MTRTIRRSAPHAVPLFALSALLLVLAAPAAADTPIQSDCAPSLAFLGAESPEAVLFGPVAGARDTSIDGPSALSTCTAECGDGSTVTCTGTSCTADDTDCSAGEQGQCWGSDTGTKYCPDTCEPACDTTYCQGRHGTSCDGTKTMSTCTIWPDDGCGSCLCDGTSWVCTL